MDLATLLPQVIRRWWLVAIVATLAAVGAALTVGGGAQRHERTIHFVLRPDADVSNRDLPNALEELKSDGPLVQTVIGVLGGQDMLRAAASSSGVRLTPQDTVTSTARPGSSLIDSTLSGSSTADVDRLAGGFARAASDYVATNYSAYALDRLGDDAGGAGTGLSATQAVLLALILGTALGVGLVAAELRLEPVLRPALGRRAARRAPPSPAAHCKATTAKGTACRNRPIDERGYCRAHVGLIESGGGARHRANGSGDPRALTEPAVRAIRTVVRRRTPSPPEEEG
jgi:hypothetical protein